MKNLRKYGIAPFHVALVHGGPGIPGDMAPVAKELSQTRGILEPLQTKTTIDGQIDELKSVIQNDAEPPITLIGYSWGAWLSVMLTAQNPSLIKKLILISSGPFEESYVDRMNKTRFGRFSEEDQKSIHHLLKTINDTVNKEANAAFAKLGELIAPVEFYDALPHESDTIEFQGNIFKTVWNDANDLRKSGELLEMAKQIRCPVAAIHGDYDAHPAEGVEKPLSTVLNDFRFILLERCGHTPWYEKHAREAFFTALEKELTAN